MKRLVWLACLLAMSACTTPATQDLYAQAQQARATADAAQDLAEFQERYLTATAEAPIIRITETAAGLIVQATQNSIDRTSTAVLWTPTASPIPSITPSPTANAEATGTFTVLNAIGTQVGLDVERQEQQNEFKAVLPGIVFALIAGASILALLWVSRRERYRPAAVDQRGNLLPVFDYVEGTVTDPDRMPNYRGELREDLFKQWLRQWMQERLHIKPQLPEVTADRQDAVTQRDQMIDLAVRGLPEQKPDERRKKTGEALALPAPLPNLENRFKVLEPGAHNLDVIDGEIIEVLDQDWKEAEQK
jgi:hypothetical protein